MSITDELRVFARRWPCTDYINKDIIAIADRIDAEHESACAEAYGNGVMSVPIALDESAWVELPKDADGEYIHVGDVLTDDAEFKSEGNVECLMFDESGWMVGFGKGWTDVRIHEWHHYHAPTVEDVLREMLDAWGELPSNVTNEAIIAEYAKRLTLAEGEGA